MYEQLETPLSLPDLESSTGLHMSSPLSLRDLPPDLLIKIVLMLPDAKSIIACMLTCRSFRNDIELSARAQYALTLRAWGYYDDGNEMELMDGSSSYEEMPKLQQHIDNWNRLDWEETSVRIPHPEVQEHINDIYASIDRATRKVLTIVDLPSRIRNQSAVVRTHPIRFNYPVKNMIMDIDQDLIVLIELYVEC